MRRCQKFFFSFFFLLIGVPDAPLSEIESAREREKARAAE
jgi:hypothetical protein